MDFLTAWWLKFSSLIVPMNKIEAASPFIAQAKQSHFYTLYESVVASPSKLKGKVTRQDTQFVGPSA